MHDFIKLTPIPLLDSSSPQLILPHSPTTPDTLKPPMLTILYNSSTLKCSPFCGMRWIVGMEETGQSSILVDSQITTVPGQARSK